LNFFKRRNKVSDSETAKRLNEIVCQLHDLNDKVDCLQRSQAVLYQILPGKLREAIIEGLNERNSRSFPL
jgi:hypothetical protein